MTFVQYIIRKLFTNRLCLLALLAWLAMSTSSCTFYFTPNGGSFSGTTSYCQGATAAPNSFVYTVDLCGVPGIFDATSGTTCTAQWYVNTTGSTSIPASTAYGAPIVFFTSSAAGAVNYTPSTATMGTFYYFVQITWSTGTCISPFTSGGTQMITIGPSGGVMSGPSQVCSGSTITLTNSVAGGTWSSSAPGIASVTSAGYVTGVAASGTATITYSTGSGCYVTQVVTVNPLPLAFSVTGGGSYCTGSSGVDISLSSSQTGVNYQIYNGAATVGSPTGGTGSGFSFGAFTTAGTYSVLATNATTGCSRAMTGSAVVTVNPPPAAISGPSSICQSDTRNYTDATGMGTWSSSTTTVGTINSTTGDLYGMGPGTTVVSYTLPTGCYATQVVTVNAVAPITGPTALCMGTTGTLANTVAGGTWISGNTAVLTIGSSSGAMSTAASGTSVVTYTTPAGCPIYATGTVNPLPSPISGSLLACQGLTSTLTNTGGGTWTSGTPAVADIGSSSGVVLGASSGTTVITYTLSTSCFTTAVVTVNPAPATIGGTLTVCQGSTTSLSDATSGGTWSSSNSGIASVNSSGVVAGNATGTANVIYTITSTGCYIMATVTVNPLPAAISGPASVCAGLTVTLTDAGGGTWTSSTTSTADIGSSSGIVTGNASGTTTITYTLSTGCRTTRTESVNPLPASITGTNTVCVGLTTTLSTTTGSGTWTSSNTGIATVNSSGVVTGAAGGTATITFTITATGCYTTRVVSVNALPSAISGSLAVCVGSNTSLGSPPTGGTWVSGNTAAGTISSSGVLTGIAAGTSIITYTATTGCTRTAIASINALPANIGGTQSVCLGSVTTLTNGTGSGTWSSNNTAIATVGASNGAVSGVSAGTAIISYIITATGCYTTAIVTVNALPSAISGPANACLGATTTLSSLPNTGTWTSGNTSVATVGSNTGIVTGSALGTAYITYTLNTGCFVTLNVSVNPLPAAITGPSIVCANGNTITLSTTSTTGTWSSSNTALATANAATGVITGISAGTVNISYTITATGCYVTKAVTVMPLPSAFITPIGDTIFCPGGFVTLTSSTGTGYAYQWYNTAGPISGATAATYIATAADAYQVEVLSPAGCSTLTNPINVIIDAPTAAISVSGGGAASGCAGAAITLDAATGAGYAYQWLQDGLPVSGAIGSSFTTTSAGDFAVVVTNGAGCSSTSTTITVTINPLPTPTITASGALTFCSGVSLTLSAPPDADYNYQWYNTSGAIGGATASDFTVGTAGSYWVVISTSAGCTATSATSVVAVNPLPSTAIVTSGPTVFCSGGSVMLNATSGGYTYQWYMGSTAITGATNATYTASATGGYHVRVTSTSTGCTATGSPDTMVTMLSMPYIVPLSSTAYCWGGSALLSTSVSGIGSILFQWYKDGVAIPGAAGNTYNATAPANYRCEITVPASCTMATTDATVTENPLPNPVVVFNGTTFSVATYYTSYQWYKDAASIPGATNWNTPATGNGNYKVAVTDTNGCQSMSALYVLTGWTGGSTGITVTGTDDIAIYPNPTRSMVHIATDRDIRVNVNAVDGRSMMNGIIEKDIDLSMLADGIYLIQVYDTDNQLIKAVRLVKNGN